MTLRNSTTPTTNLLAYVSFLLLKRGTTNFANKIYEVAVLPAFYGPNAPAPPTPHEQLLIEVDDPHEPDAIARVRSALTERFKELSHLKHE
ncbi:hypothetical protein [Variovorax boronicumulans]|uniref:hypothetical protein n=1 Tax=Variovorax boronicumulans TaxID=436515 RepID=UPI003396B359